MKEIYADLINSWVILGLLIYIGVGFICSLVLFLYIRQDEIIEAKNTKNYEYIYTSLFDVVLSTTLFYGLYIILDCKHFFITPSNPKKN
jgi:hypothetical protein